MKDFENIFDPSLPSCLTSFLNYMLAIKGKSPNTIKGYKNDLTLFIKFIMAYKYNKSGKLEEIDISDFRTEKLNDLTLDDLVAFITYSELKRDNQSNAKARKVAAIRSFFNYQFTKEKSISVNPAKELDSPKIGKTLPTFLTLEESKQLLRVVTGKNKNRDYAILILFLNCGLRLSELCSIDISSIKEDTLKVTGKGNKERIIYLNPSCIAAINEYMINREKIKDEITPEDEDALFISNKKNRLSPRAVERMVKKYILKAGFDYEKYSPHKLRHTAATLMYKHGDVDIRSLQFILGHESVSTTQIYTHIDDQKLREAVKKNPLADI